MHENLAMNREVVLLFLDLSKAFNCVDVDTLLAKLDKHGFRGKFSQWIKSFLKDRPQYVEIKDDHKGIKSTGVSVSMGVPQGSVLGHLMFSIYTNDLSNFVKGKAECVMFADDCVLIISEESRNKLTEKLENVILLLNSYFSANNLCMNLKKTHFMQVRKSYLSTHSWTLHLNHPETKAVTQTKKHKFLGVMVDEFFNWKMQIDNICTKLQNLGYVFRKLCKYADSITVKTAYHGYNESRLTYGISAWGCSSKENIERVFKKQKKILRIMSKVDKTASCRKLFVDMKIMTLPCLIIKNCCLEV